MMQRIATQQCLNPSQQKKPQTPNMKTQMSQLNISSNASRPEDVQPSQQKETQDRELHHSCQKTSSTSGYLNSPVSQKLSEPLRMMRKINYDPFIMAYISLPLYMQKHRDHIIYG